LALKDNAFKLSSSNHNATKMSQAITDYQAAIPILEKLSSPDPTTRRGYSTTKCGDFLRGSRANVNMAYEKYNELKNKEEIRNREIELNRIKAEQTVRDRLKKKEEEELLKAEKQLRLEAEAEEIAARTRQLQLAWDKEKDKPKTRKVPKKKRKTDDLGLGSDNEGGEENPAQEGNTSPTIQSSLEQYKQARTRKNSSTSKRKQTGEEEEESKTKRKRLTKKKQEVAEERPEEGYEGIPEREDGVLLFEDSDGGEE